ncbi:RNA 2',3'-cyclic phosphodiesterase [Candidatus Solirubrobacter pratensis]|uniref:RNA 2',3'-cyclic phosphodiesterase n=1 Tax=Candidatus Solirubrobacter pratensis TaxID=1298857 RepID=UPI0003F75A57|nr:RNA 2',3'-cyclic phosphodiesterase [Candidatus Solirubrobacter pratensis]
MSLGAGERPWRLFVALDLPPGVRAALAAAGAAADPDVWRPVAPDSLHLTLAFLGSRPPADVEAIARVLEAQAGTPAPRLALGDALLLPPRRARVLTVALEDSGGALGELQAGVSSGLEAAGVYTPERRPYRAHITVARVRPHAQPPRAAEAHLERLAFSAGRLTLYRSQLHPKGSRYSPLRAVSLAG